MDFNLDIKEKGPPLVAPLSFTVTEDMKLEIQRIKRSSKRNQRLVNDLMRQFLTQIIEKYNAGKFGDSAQA